MEIIALVTLVQCLLGTGCSGVFLYSSEALMMKSLPSKASPQAEVFP